MKKAFVVVYVLIAPAVAYAAIPHYAVAPAWEVRVQNESALQRVAYA
jgi:hypothetical protein